MTNGVLRVCVWVLASLALSGNCLVIVWRLLYETDNKVVYRDGDMVTGEGKWGMEEVLWEREEKSKRDMIRWKTWNREKQEV